MTLTLNGVVVKQMLAWEKAQGERLQNVNTSVAVNNPGVKLM